MINRSSYLFAGILFLGAMKVMAAPISCSINSDSSGKNAAYFCDGVQVTQTFKTFFEPGSTISEFKVHNGTAYWRYTNTSGGGVQQIKTKTAYYVNRRVFSYGSLRWMGIESLTQEAESFGGFNEQISEFKIQDNGRATWRFNKSNSTSIGSSYFTKCPFILNDFRQLTQQTNSNIAFSESIQNFKITEKDSSEEVTWTFVSRSPTSSISNRTNHTLDISRCIVPNVGIIM